MITFTNPRYAGLLPEFFSLLDPRPARDQLHDSYAHGGGVRPFKGFTLSRDWRNSGTATLHYPQDPPMREVSRGMLREETIILFESSWLAIVQPSGDYLICRVD